MLSQFARWIEVYSMYIPASCAQWSPARKDVLLVIWFKRIRIYHCINAVYISLPKLKSACPGTSLHHGYHKLHKKLVPKGNYSQQEKHVTAKLSYLLTCKGIWYLHCFSAHQDSEHSWYSILYVQTAKFLTLINRYNQGQETPNVKGHTNFLYTSKLQTSYFLNLW